MSASKKSWAVTIDYYSDPALRTWTHRLVFEHASPKAAKRRMGSIIAGKQNHRIAGKNIRIYATNAHDNNVHKYTWTDLRNLIEEGAL
jgi:hypothetical protein